MTKYYYKAKKNNAETVTGTIHAQTQEEAIDLINQLGLLPVDVSIDQIQSSKTSKKRNQQPWRGFFSAKKEIYYFSHQLANLTRSGVALLNALEMLLQQDTHPQFKQIIQSCIDAIRQGSSLSQALQNYPEIFPKLYISLVRAGEESGNLSSILRTVANYYQQQNEIRNKVRNALAYPILMGVVGVGTIYFVLTYVMPKMSSLFRNLGDDLPFSTKMLLSMSSWLSESWLVVVVATCVVLLLLGRFFKTKDGKRYLSELTLKTPMINNFFLKLELAQFAESMQLLLRGGVSIVEALQVSIPILRNEIIKEKLEIVRKELIGGGSFGQSLLRINEIPRIFSNLILIGEEAGHLESVLADISEDYQRETNENLKFFTSLLEPLMILFIGLIIGFMVFSMLLPIFQADVLVG